MVVGSRVVSEVAGVAETTVFVGGIDDVMGGIEGIPVVRVSLGVSVPRSFVFVELIVSQVTVGALSAEAATPRVVGVVNLLVDAGS